MYATLSLFTPQQEVVLWPTLLVYTWWGVSTVETMAKPETKWIGFQRTFPDSVFKHCRLGDYDQHFLKNEILKCVDFCSKE